MWWTPILELLGQVLTKVIPDAAARDKAMAEIQAQLLANDKALAEAARDVLVAEAKGESWMQRNWRPLFMLCIVFVIMANGFFLPILSAMTRVDLVKLQGWDAIPQALWSLAQIGVGGYVVGRSAEKIADSMAKGQTGRGGR